MNPLFTVLLIAALLTVHSLWGGGSGDRLIYSLPAYVLLGCTGLLTLLTAWRARRIRCSGGCLLATLLFAVYAFLRISYSPVPFIARWDLFPLLASLVVYLIVAVVLVEPKQRVAICWALLAMAVANVGVGAVQAAKMHTYLPFSSEGRPDYGWRASGFYTCPNHLAGFLEVMVVLGLSLVYWGRFRPWVKLLGGYLTGVCAAGVMLTGSRGGYLSSVVAVASLSVLSLATLWLVKSRRFVLQLVVAVVGIGLIVAGVAFAVLKHDVIKYRAERALIPDEVRLELWQAALKQFALQPVFGTGSRTYLYYGRQFRDPKVQTDPLFAHGDYVQFLAEYGIVGSVLFLLLLIAHLRNGFASWRKLTSRLKESNSGRSNALALTLGSLAALGAFMVHSVFDFNMHIPANTLLMALVFGMLANPGMELAAPSNADRARFAAMLSRFSVPVAGLALLILSLRSLPGEYYVERARMALYGGKHKETISFAKQALRWQGNSADLYFYRGEARRLLVRGNPQSVIGKAFNEAAIQDYDKAIALFPQDVRFHLKKARSLDGLGRFEDAEKALEEAIRQDPNSARVYAYRGLHLHFQGRDQEAMEQYSKALSLDYDRLAVFGIAFAGQGLTLSDLDNFKSSAQLLFPGLGDRSLKAFFTALDEDLEADQPDRARLPLETANASPSK